MKSLDNVTASIVQWHHDKKIIDGATDWTQTEKMLEEFIELVASQLPTATPEGISAQVCFMVRKLEKKGKIKTVERINAHDEKIDAVGDMFVVGINILERNEVSLETCLNGVYDIISKRSGKVVDGSFVKD